MTLVRLRNRSEMLPWFRAGDIQREFDRLFGDIGKDFGMFRKDWAPAVDLSETDDAYLIEADVPGIKQQDIQLEVDGQIVTIKGERKEEVEQDEDRYHRVERHSGAFRRAIRIPGVFDADAAKATFENGVLRVTLPKREESKPKRIKVAAN